MIDTKMEEVEEHIETNIREEVKEEIKANTTTRVDDKFSKLRKELEAMMHSTFQQQLAEMESKRFNGPSSAGLGQSGKTEGASEHILQELNQAKAERNIMEAHCQ